jgi:hypothetical protein
MKWESSSYEQENENMTEQEFGSHRRRLLRLGTTVVVSAMAGMLAFGGTQGTSDQPHNPNSGNNDPAQGAGIHDGSVPESLPTAHNVTPGPESVVQQLVTAQVVHF